MNSLKKRSLIAVVVIAAILLVLGAYGYFIGTRTLLNQAEAFSFRRMKVAQLADEGSFRFFYVTNRRTKRREGAVEERFGNEREARLTFGLFDTEIERKETRYYPDASAELVHARTRIRCHDAPREAEYGLSRIFQRRRKNEPTHPH